jgi:hypothetical protein
MDEHRLRGDGSPVCAPCQHSRNREAQRLKTISRRVGSPGDVGVCSSGCLVYFGGFEAVAAADGRDFEVESGVFWVAAIVKQRGFSLMACENGDDSARRLMMLAEVIAESALSVLYLHDVIS